MSICENAIPAKPMKPNVQRTAIASERPRSGGRWVAVREHQEKQDQEHRRGHGQDERVADDVENSSATIPLPNRVMPPWSALETVNPACFGYSLADSNRPA